MSFRLIVLCDHPGCTTERLVCDELEEALGSNPPLAEPMLRSDVVFDTGWMNLPRGWRWRETDTERKGVLCPTHAPRPTPRSTAA